MLLQIQRSIAYEKSTKEVTNWQNIIVQNQKAEQLVFPLNQEPSGPKRVEQVVAGWKVSFASDFFCTLTRQTLTYGMYCVCYRTG